MFDRKKIDKSRSDFLSRPFDFVWDISVRQFTNTWKHVRTSVKLVLWRNTNLFEVM